MLASSASNSVIAGRVSRNDLDATSWRMNTNSTHVVVEAANSWIRIKRTKWPRLRCAHTENELLLSLVPRPESSALTVSLNAQRMRLVLDSLGAVQVYYYDDGIALWFANTLGDLIALLPSADIPELDDEMLVERLARMSSNTDRTLLKGVFVLAENATLDFRRDGVSLADSPHSFVSERLNVCSQIVYDDPILEFTRRVKLAWSDVGLDEAATCNVAASLSGGADSAVIAHSAVALGHMVEPVVLLSMMLGGSQGGHQAIRIQETVQFLKGESVSVQVEQFPVYRASQFADVTVHDIDRELYWHATEAMLDLATSAGVDVLLTGFGGDELFVEDPGEHVGFQGEQERNRRSTMLRPEWLTEAAWEMLGASSVPLEKHLLPNIPHSVRRSQRAYNGLCFRRGIWPIAILGHPALWMYTRKLPRSWRANKRLLEVHRAQAGFPDSMLNLRIKDSFGDHYYESLLAVRGHIEMLLDHSVLADRGIVETNAVRDLFVNVIKNGVSRATNSFMAVLECELFLQSLRRRQQCKI